MDKAKKVTAVLTMLLCINTHLVFSQQAEKTKYTPGFIFSTSNLLLDLESYQGGVGFMLHSPKDTWRFSVGVEYESGADLFSTQLGVTYLRPFLTGKVSPYWGGSLVGGLSLDKDEVDGNNWQSLNEYTLFVGGLLGVEFSLHPRFSLFAEYSLGIEVAWIVQSISVGGEVTNTGTNNYSVGTALGNSGSIGVVVFFGEDP